MWHDISFTATNTFLISVETTGSANSVYGIYKSISNTTVTAVKETSIGIIYTAQSILSNQNSKGLLCINNYASTSINKNYFAHEVIVSNSGANHRWSDGWMGKDTNSDTLRFDPFEAINEVTISASAGTFDAGSISLWGET